eukprot:jgi/Mesen1/10249/ME000774S09581
MLSPAPVPLAAPPLSRVTAPVGALPSPPAAHSPPASPGVSPAPVPIPTPVGVLTPAPLRAYPGPPPVHSPPASLAPSPVPVLSPASLGNPPAIAPPVGAYSGPPPPVHSPPALPGTSPIPVLSPAPAAVPLATAPPVALPSAVHPPAAPPPASVSPPATSSPPSSSPVQPASQPGVLLPPPPRATSSPSPSPQPSPRNTPAPVRAPVLAPQPQGVPASRPPLVKLAPPPAPALGLPLPPPPPLTELQKITLGLQRTNATQLLALLHLTGLDAQLALLEKATLLVPSDLAFASMPAEVEALLAGPDGAAYAATLLRYHTVPLYKDFSGLLATPGLSTLPTLLVSTPLLVYVSNGSVSFTAGGSGSGGDAGGARRRLLDGSTGITVPQPAVGLLALPDILADGVISMQGVDGVLVPPLAALLNATAAPPPPASRLPPPPPPLTELQKVALALQRANATRLLALLRLTGLDAQLGRRSNMSMLAPSDDAFARMPEKIKALLDGPDGAAYAANLLRYHMIPLYRNYAALSAARGLYSLPTLLAKPVLVYTEAGQVFFSSSESGKVGGVRRRRLLDGGTGIVVPLSAPSALNVPDILDDGILSVQGLEAVLIPPPDVLLNAPPAPPGTAAVSLPPCCSRSHWREGCEPRQSRGCLRSPAHPCVEVSCQHVAAK